MEKKILTFKKMDGTVIEKVEQYVRDWINRYPHGKIIIGCDSQVYGRRIKFSIAVIMHIIDDAGGGHGAHVISADVWEKRMKSISQIEEMPAKLWKEAEYVLHAAEMIDAEDETFKKKITIHLDFNSKETEKSNMLYAAGVGMIKGMGFHAEGKPNAWGATHVADALCR